MRNTKEMPWVRFPHLAHSQWLDCRSCHPAPFAEKAGAAPTTMERIFRGEACGMCHGKVAFPAWNQCERCHSVVGPRNAGAGGGAR
jgi:c(7)-type cytochrome triheme protein